MPKRIVICIDGTRNKFGQRPSNVLRLYEAAVKDRDQLTYYQPGVGTLVPAGVLGKVRNILLRALDAATAWMMERHITAPYRWLMQQDIEGAEIFVFGFSRGAYAARALCGMLKTVGLLRADYEEMVPFAFQEYLSSYSKEKRHDEFRRVFSREAKISYLGLWDTVSSYGTPWHRRTLPYTYQNDHVDTVRHAVALDERRAMFTTNLWKQQPAHTDLQEIWFAGHHADVGGGAGGGSAAKDELSLIPFAWVLQGALNKGLDMDGKELETIVGGELARVDARSFDAPLHDPMNRWWALLEYLPILRRMLRPSTQADGEWTRAFRPNRMRPRDVPANAQIHPTVYERMRVDKSYRPPNLALKPPPRPSSLPRDERATP